MFSFDERARLFAPLCKTEKELYADKKIITPSRCPSPVMEVARVYELIVPWCTGGSLLSLRAVCKFLRKKIKAGAVLYRWGLACPEGCEPEDHLRRVAYLALFDRWDLEQLEETAHFFRMSQALQFAVQGYVRRVYYEREDNVWKLCWEVMPSLKWRVTPAGRDKPHKVVARFEQGVLLGPACTCVAG